MATIRITIREISNDDLRSQIEAADHTADPQDITTGAAERVRERLIVAGFGDQPLADVPERIWLDAIYPQGVIAMMAARAEGLAVWTIRTTAGAQEFLAVSAEDAGFCCDDNGSPRCDCAGNTVTGWTFRNLEDDDTQLALEWFEGR